MGVTGCLEEWGLPGGWSSGGYPVVMYIQIDDRSYSKSFRYWRRLAWRSLFCFYWAQWRSSNSDRFTVNIIYYYKKITYKATIYFEYSKLNIHFEDLQIFIQEFKKY